MTRNRIENCKRWNVERLNKTDVECCYQQEIQQKLKGNHQPVIDRKNGRVYRRH